MEIVLAIGRASGLALAAGLNLYATLLALGLASRFDLIQLPAAYEPLGSNTALAAFVVLYLIEFLADKIPWLDTAWDLIHTIVRPLGGAFLAIMAMGPSPPEVDVAAAVLGVALAGTSHLTKSSTRVVANATLIPGLGLALSLAEDAIALVLAALVVFVPLVALFVAAVLFAVFVWLLLMMRRRLKKRRSAIRPGVE
ncbi:MAG: DUF4126 domain-containing protein [Gemmatimonadota bacterium]|jgi:hypothetical protein